MHDCPWHTSRLVRWCQLSADDRRQSIGRKWGSGACRDEAAREAHGCTALPGLRQTRLEKLKSSARSLDSAHSTTADCWRYYNINISEDSCSLSLTFQLYLSSRPVMGNVSICDKNGSRALTAPSLLRQKLMTPRPDFTLVITIAFSELDHPLRDPLLENFTPPHTYRSCARCFRSTIQLSCSCSLAR